MAVGLRLGSSRLRVSNVDADCETLKYGSFEELLDDGWVVD
jgi:hypothetical protein